MKFLSDNEGRNVWFNVLNYECMNEWIISILDQDSCWNYLKISMLDNLKLLLD